MAKKLHKTIEKLLRADPNHKRLAEILHDTPPLELAACFRQLNLEDQHLIFERLTHDELADTVVHIDKEILRHLINEVDLRLLAQVVGHLDVDDAADIVPLLEAERFNELLDILPNESSNMLIYLLSYPIDSAGRMMNPVVAWLEKGKAVSDAVKVINRFVGDYDEQIIYNLFVVDDKNVLVGQVPLWKIATAARKEPIENLIDEAPAVVADQDQELVSRIMVERDLASIAVVDNEGHLLGRITHDVMVDVLNKEHEEDIGNIGGTGGESVNERSVMFAVRSRLPWLSVALFGELAVAAYMANKIALLESFPELTFFVPLIMGIGGMSAIQSSTLVIRGFSMGKINFYDFLPRLWREVAISLWMGLGLAVLLFPVSLFITTSMEISFLLSLSTIICVMMATLVGVITPFILYFVKIDQAMATGPFITTLNDLLGIAIYLFIALTFLL